MAQQFVLFRAVFRSWKCRKCGAKGTATLRTRLLEPVPDLLFCLMNRVKVPNLIRDRSGIHPVDRLSEAVSCRADAA